MDNTKLTNEEKLMCVDLDLPSGLKWASCNIGATVPEGCGNYYAWGEIAPKVDYSWATYKYANGDKNKLTKYCYDVQCGNEGFIDNKKVLDLEDDAARVNWGGKWRMPTNAEWAELRAMCTWTWTTQNGVNGYLVTSKTNGNFIFLPATGRYESYLYDGDSLGFYWSSSLRGSLGGGFGGVVACFLCCGSDSVLRSAFDRNNGCCVRPVCP